MRKPEHLYSCGGYRKGSSAKSMQGEICGGSKTRRLASKHRRSGKGRQFFNARAGIHKRLRDYTYTHSVNVALLATCLGRQINMSDISLEFFPSAGFYTI